MTVRYAVLCDFDGTNAQINRLLPHGWVGIGKTSQLKFAHVQMRRDRVRSQSRALEGFFDLRYTDTFTREGIVDVEALDVTYAGSQLDGL